MKISRKFIFFSAACLTICGTLFLIMFIAREATCIPKDEAYFQVGSALFRVPRQLTPNVSPTSGQDPYCRLPTTRPVIVTGQLILNSPDRNYPWNGHWPESVLLIDISPTHRQLNVGLRRETQIIKSENFYSVQVSSGVTYQSKEPLIQGMPVILQRLGRGVNASRFLAIAQFAGTTVQFQMDIVGNPDAAIPTLASVDKLITDLRRFSDQGK